MTTTPCFFDLAPGELESFCTEHGLKRFVAAQILDWVYQKGVVDPGAMTNLSKSARELLQQSMTFYRSDVLAHQCASDGTQKLLLGWHNAPTPVAVPSGAMANVEGTALPVVQRTVPERQTETVMIPTEDRKTACVSSQVGCPVGCTFCASGIGGLEGNLSSGQILEQVHRLNALKDVGRISNIVFMGMGEPLANFSAVTDAIRTLNAPWGFGISARRITVSTVGMPRAIRKLVEFELPVTLALSLHAPNDDLRRQLIPWADYTTIAELIEACDEYFDRTGREITLEYILIRDVNDRPEHARELAHVATRLRANINLIRYNEVRGMPYSRPTTADVREFQKVLREHRRNAHIRASRGRDIAAACGQLRHERRAGSA